jgi:hypothetical protein
MVERGLAWLTRNDLIETSLAAEYDRLDGFFSALYGGETPTVMRK